MAARPRTAMVRWGGPVAVALVALAMTAAVLTRVTGAAPQSGGAGDPPTASRAEGSMDWPVTLRYVEEVTERGDLLSTTTYQFTGLSWDDWIVTTLSIEDEEGRIAAAQTGYTVRYRAGTVEMGYLNHHPSALSTLSVEAVNELLARFGENQEEVETATVPLNDQAPSGLFNANWIKDWASAEGEGEPLMTAVPHSAAAKVPTVLSAAADAALIEVAARLALPAADLAPVYGAAAIGPGGTTFAVLHRDTLVPLAAETVHGGITSSMSVIERSSGGAR